MRQDLKIECNLKWPYFHLVTVIDDVIPTRSFSFELKNPEIMIVNKVHTCMHFLILFLSSSLLVP